MKKNRIFFLVLFLLLGSKAYAQWEVGIAGGYVHNTLSTSSGYYYNRQYLPGNSFSASIPVYYHFRNGWFALATELSYLEKNYRMEYYGNTFSKFEYEDVKNSYLQIPVMANFSFGGKRLRGFTNAGVYLGAWLNSHVKGRVQHTFSGDYYEYDEPLEFDSRRDNRFEYGLLFSLGLRFQCTKSIGIFAEARYLYGLSDLQKDYMLEQYPRYNTSIQAQLGITYKFK